MNWLSACFVIEGWCVQTLLRTKLNSFCLTLFMVWRQKGRKP